MRQHLFQPCIPTRGTKVPAGPDWLHEIKHDGYRLMVWRAPNVCCRGKKRHGADMVKPTLRPA